MSLCQSKGKCRSPNPHATVSPLLVPTRDTCTKGDVDAWGSALGDLPLGAPRGWGWPGAARALQRCTRRRRSRNALMQAQKYFPWSAACCRLSWEGSGEREGWTGQTDGWDRQTEMMDGWDKEVDEWNGQMDGVERDRCAGQLIQGKAKPQSRNSVGSTQKPKAGARLLQSGTFNGDVELNGQKQQKGTLPAPRGRSGWGWTAGEGRARRCRWGTRDGGTRAGGRCRPTAAGHGHGTGLLMMQHPNCTPRG